MSTRILLSAPDVGRAEERAVVAAMRSGWVAPLGPDVDAFERELAARVGVRRGVALSSGTAALHLGLLALGVRPGDRVLASSMTFAATINAIAYVGAHPVLVDAEPATGNVDVRLLAEAAGALEREGTPARAVVPVDLLGRVADVDAIARIAARHGMRVLSDAAESLGSTRGGRPAGSFGDASIVSFNGNKVMTTSGGGMLLTSDDGIADRVRHLSTQARLPLEHYEHDEVGFNYRLSNLLAALGRAQLRRLDEMIARRRAIRDRYRQLVQGIDGVELLGAEHDDGDNAWLTAIVVDPRHAHVDAAAVRAALDERGIETRPLWKPMHLQPAFADARAFVTGVGERLFRTGVVLPSGSSLDEASVERVLDGLTAALAPRSLRKPIGSDFPVLVGAASPGTAAASPVASAAVARPWKEATALVETGRQAIALIASLLERSGVRRIALPGFLCDSMIAPYRALGWTLHRYPVLDDLSPDLGHARRLAEAGAVDAVLVMRYFGSAPTYADIADVAAIRTLGVPVVADETHLPFSLNQWGADYAYASLRKVLPTSDGAYVHLPADADPPALRRSRETGRYAAMTTFDAEHDISPHSRMLLDASMALLERDRLPRRASRRGRGLLDALDLDALARRRVRNARVLADALVSAGIAPAVDPDALSVPSHLPVRVADPSATQAAMAAAAVYCPIHWPRPTGFAAREPWPDDLLSLPVDHRYDDRDMQRIAMQLEAVTR
ncbi:MULTISPECIES: DegT/DnrJ/EryC1/StrS family aminotransferase [unclassified Agrococcus]|uniref:DegT/DnrJ/EryC1/StrS family aminotransferase n=1 Tax=unclassified Agrococcus TaxID=2615065 RepID=UPI003610EC03